MSIFKVDWIAGNAGHVTLHNNIGSALNGLHYDIKWFGATGDGETDDTSAITDAIAAIPAAGGVLYFPPGTYITSGGFTLSYPTIIQGCGAGNILGDGAVTTVVCNHATNSLFTVNSRRATFRDIALKNTNASPSNGAGITVTSAYIHQRVDYDSISVYGFYIDIDIQVGAHWVMDKCFILNPVLYGVKIANTVNGDAGDWAISNSNLNTVDRNATSAIYIASSGGGKISNIKINRNPPGTVKNFTNGIELVNVANTVILNMVNSSIENVTGFPVTITGSGNTSWRDIIISNNQFGQYAVADHAILIEATSPSVIENVVITGNVFKAYTESNAAISMTNVSGGVVGGNVIAGYTPALEQTNCSGIETIAYDA